MWALFHLSLPVRVAANLQRVFFVILSGIATHIGIIGLPVVKMTDKQVMIASFDLAERNQITRVQFQLRIQMKWLDMMDLYAFALVSADLAGGLVL